MQPGDHIIARGSFCGVCEQCLTGHLNLCPNKPGRSLDDTPRITLNGERVHTRQSNISSFAEYILLHENGLVKIRKDVPLDVAALVGCAVMTGVGAALNTARCTRAPVWPSLAIGESCVRHEAVLRTTAQRSPREHRSLGGRPAGDGAELRPAR